MNWLREALEWLETAEDAGDNAIFGVSIALIVLAYFLHRMGWFWNS